MNCCGDMSANGPMTIRGRVPQICLDLFARQLCAGDDQSAVARRSTTQRRETKALGARLRRSRIAHAGAAGTAGSDCAHVGALPVFPGRRVSGHERCAACVARTARFAKVARDRANLFIVGDRKQSIYGFRGADVDVFREMTATLLAAGGEEKPLQLNFRSQPPLIAFFNLSLSRGCFRCRSTCRRANTRTWTSSAT